MADYFVYDPGVGDMLGGVRVKTDANGRRVVSLAIGQADYLIQAGAVGLVPLDQVDAETLAHLHQVSGGRIPLDPGAPPSGPVRNAKQNPNTMASALAQGYHPVLGTVESGKTGRKRSSGGGKAAISKSFEG